MHKSAFQLLRRISLILIFMTDRQTSFPGFFGRLNIHSLTLCVELYACSSPSRAASILRGDLLSFHSSYTIWVTPRRPSVRRLLGLLQGFFLLFQAIIYHFHSPPERRTRRLGCTTNKTTPSSSALQMASTSVEQLYHSLDLHNLVSQSKTSRRDTNRTAYPLHYTYLQGLTDFLK